MMLLDRPPLAEQIVKPYMLKKALGNERHYDVFHPSAWGGCQRKIAYQYYNEQEHFLKNSSKDIKFRIERIFDNGHSMHARWRDYLRAVGVLRGAWKCLNEDCGLIYGSDPNNIGMFDPSRDPKWKCSCGSHAVAYEEAMVKSDEFNFEGHVDAIIDVRGTSHAKGGKFDVFVLDMKTIKDDMFAGLRAAKSEHVVQVNIYMWLLDLNGATVLYEDKDNQSIKEMFVPRDDHLIERIKREAKLMLKLLSYRKLPNRPAGMSRSKFPCRFCEFSSLCYA